MKKASKVIFATVVLLSSGLAVAQYVGPTGTGGERAAPINHPVMPANHPLMNSTAGNTPVPANHPVMPANHPLMTIAALQQQGKDDMRVTLEGYIVRHQREDYYIFSDGSGELLVDIDPEYFPAGKPVDAKTKVRLSGKLDVDAGEPMELDVKHLTILP